MPVFETLARDLLEKRRDADEKRLASKTANDARDAAEMALVEAMKDQKMKAGTWDLGPPWGVYHMTRREPTVYAKVEEPEMLLKWANETARTEEIYSEPGVRKKVLNGLVKQFKDAGQPMPDGVSWYENEGITATAKKT